MDKIEKYKYRRNYSYEEKLIEHIIDSNSEPFVRRDVHGDIIDMSSNLSASEYSNCIRKLYYEKMSSFFVGSQDNKPTNGYFIRGKNMEKWIEKVLSNYLHENNALLTCSGSNQFTLVGSQLGLEPSKGRYLVGTPDGVIIRHISHEGGDCTTYYSVIEIKTVSSAVLDATPSHIMQLQINMELVRAYYEGPDWADDHDDNKNSCVMEPGLLIYVNASDWADITIFEVSTYGSSKFVWDVAGPRSEALFTHGIDTLPFEGVKSRECTGCPFRDKCMDALATRDDDTSVANLKKMRGNTSDARFPVLATQEEVDRARGDFQSYIMYQEQRKEIEAREKDLREMASAYVFYCGGKAQFDDYDATLSCRVNKSWKTKNLEDLLEEIGVDPSEYKNYSESPVLTIRGKKQ
jgi:CRISPR/Cas system-associated exonuclease Cas4 (RecB family)